MLCNFANRHEALPWQKYQMLKSGHLLSASKERQTETVVSIVHTMAFPSHHSRQKDENGARSPDNCTS